MNHQQVEQLEKRLTCIENLLTHVLHCLLGAERSRIEISTEQRSDRDALLETAIRGITTSRPLSPDRGGKYPS
jgi:hypothetical protein